jgi:hypothetical protein
MPAASTTTAVRTFLRALHTGDHDLLASVALPHPELGRLLPDLSSTTPATGGDAPPAEFTAIDLPGERQLITVRQPGRQRLLIVRATEFGPRIDLRHWLAAAQPDDPRRAIARAFYRALLCGDLGTLRTLAFDPTGIEGLGATDRLLSPIDVEATVQALGLIELDLGEAFPVANGVQFVSARHHELGIVVLDGLTPIGAIPFLLRQRDGNWKVVTHHFLQAAAQERAAALRGPGMVVSRR